MEKYTKEQFWAKLESLGEDKVREMVLSKRWTHHNLSFAQEWLRIKDEERHEAKQKEIIALQKSEIAAQHRAADAAERSATAAERANNTAKQALAIAKAANTRSTINLMIAGAAAFIAAIALIK